MSSNRNKNSSEIRKMSSITHRLTLMYLREKLGRYFWVDILIFVCTAAAWLLFVEFRTIGNIGPLNELQRGFTTYGSGITNLTYYVRTLSGQSLMEFACAEGLIKIGCAVVVLGVVQVVSSLLAIPIDNKKIGTVLRPINEIAAKADEISRWTFDDKKYTFDDSKYRVIEDAITRLEPDEIQMLSFNDKDLIGIETAMNNLLVRMQESYRQQARFVNDASHELRTPIAVIEGYANMLSRWGKEDEKILDESITAIQHESAHMKKLVEQLLFLARGDAGRTQLEMHDISLRDMMREIYEESLMIDEDHPYRFSVNIAGAVTDNASDIRAVADETMLKQAVRILIDNAAKYTEKGDDILLSVGINDKGRSYVQVQDTGIGMAKSDMEHMFERFYRADEARSTDGSGLGLSIAKWIVDRHNGHFEILSRRELGTRIRIVL